ncbi:MAG TPA: hypothetical protein VG297_00950 [Bryobacteraceae bacterium]|jgi:hypothetical protein|nr:hypothetical protein [Bryobacteraceae bacterium]
MTSRIAVPDPHEPTDLNIVPERRNLPPAERFDLMAAMIPADKLHCNARRLAAREGVVHGSAEVREIDE